ncbi:metallophosphoesterase family protein [Salininema proteolyticum]|uniref:Metallophosphoesterase family protein n=1 Tax=Salininema proteolyticum TaxID=1607685 RepID=A0ABV8TZ82_9ACTN
MTLTLMHISDTHIDGSPESVRRLEAVLDLLPPSRRPDAIAVTGDVADTGADGEYRRFGEALAGREPWIAVPGNHDDSPLFAERLGVADVLDAGGLRIVGIDVSVDGEDHGVLGQEAADRAAVRAEGAEATVLAFHHPPVPIGHSLIDPTLLRNPEALRELVDRIGTVRAILCGHVHTAARSEFAGVPVLVAPGVASALKPDPDARPIIDAAQPPGLALHRFDDGGVTTTFHYAG